MLLRQHGQHKLSPAYDPDPILILARKGDLVIIERGNTLLKRNVAHPLHPVVKSGQQFDQAQPSNARAEFATASLCDVVLTVRGFVSTFSRGLARILVSANLGSACSCLDRCTAP